MSTRIQINMGPALLKDLDRYADYMGVTRSSLATVLIAQGIMNYNPNVLPPSSPSDPELVKDIPLPKEEEKISIDDILADAEKKRKNFFEENITIKPDEKDDDEKEISI